MSSISKNRPRDALLVLPVVILTLCLPARAQTALERFEEALQSWRFLEARRLLEEIPDEPTRLLAECELHLAHLRPDRTFPLTDKLDARSIPPELRGKHFYILASREDGSELGLDEQRRRVLRLVEDGLNVATRPYDRVRLLKLELGWSGDRDKARGSEILEELGKLSIMARLEEQFENLASPQAEESLRALEELATARGKPNLAMVYRAKRWLKSWTERGDARLAQSEAEELLERALKTEEPYLILEIAGRAVSYGSYVEGFDPLPVLETALGRLPPRYRVRLCCYARGDVKDEGLKKKLFEQALRDARALNDPALLTAVLQRAESAERQEEAEQLLAGLDLRGTGRAWISVRRVSKNRSAPAVSVELDQKSYANRLRAAKGKDDLASTRLNALSRSLRGEPENLAFALHVLDEVLASQAKESRPEDVFSLLEELVGSDSYGYLFGPPERDLAPGSGIVMAAWRKRTIESSPAWKELKSYLTRELSAELSDYTRQRKSFYLGLVLIVEGRFSEALELIELLEPSASKDVLLSKIGMLDGTYKGKREYAELSEAARELWYLHSRGRYGEVLERGEPWLEIPKGDDLGMAEHYGLFRVVASALHHSGRSDEAVELLDRKAREFKEADTVPYLIPIEQASILNECGRSQEALELMKRQPSHKIPEWETYRLAKLRDILRSLGKETQSAAVEEELQGLVDRLGSRLGDPLLTQVYFQSPVFRRLSLPALGKTVGTEVKESADLSGCLEALERLRRREPENSALARISAAELKALSTDAQADQLFVQPVLLTNSVAFICVARDRALVKEQFCRVDMLRETVAGIVSVASNRNSGKNLEPELEYARTHLLAPWRQLFPEQTRVYWMVEGELSTVPLSLLSRDPALSFVYLDRPALPTSLKPLSREQPALLVGGAGDLPGAERELSAVRALFSKGDSWKLGQAPHLLRELAPNHSLIHIASHGLAPNEQRLAGSLRGDGGELNAFQLAELRLSQDTLCVVTSCYGGARWGGGVDNSSLSSALRTSGAHTVIAFQWKVDDRTAGHLVEVLYRSLLQGNQPGEAVLQAQGEVRKQHPHPYYWAGLRVLSGPGTGVGRGARDVLTKTSP